MDTFKWTDFLRYGSYSGDAKVQCAVTTDTLEHAAKLAGYSHTALLDLKIQPGKEKFEPDVVHCKGGLSDKFIPVSDYKQKVKKEIALRAEIIIDTLRAMTFGQGHAGVSLFDAGAGGGFNDGTVTVYLERDGIKIENKRVYSVEDLQLLLVTAITGPFEKSFREQLDKLDRP